MLTPISLKKLIEFNGPISDIAFTLGMFCDLAIASLIVIEPSNFPLSFLGSYGFDSVPKLVLTSAYTVPDVITLFSKPGAITAIGFIVEPGCLYACVALLNPAALTSVPRPPTVPTTCPVL